MKIEKWKAIMTLNGLVYAGLFGFSVVHGISFVAVISFLMFIVTAFSHGKA